MRERRTRVLPDPLLQHLIFGAVNRMTRRISSGTMTPPTLPGASTSAAKAAAPVTTLSSDAADAPDESLLAFITRLLDFDTALASTLQPADHARITSGLSTTIDEALLHFMSTGSTAAADKSPRTPSSSTALTALNAPAAAHLLTNVRVLHHNLLIIDPSSVLPRATAFLEMFLQGREAVEREAEAEVGTGREGKLLGEREVEALKRLLGQGVGSVKQGGVAKTTG